MWWRFVTFCILVCVILFVVLSCIQGRPVLYLFFRRCCEEDIENDQAIHGNFGNNFLRERLVGSEAMVVSNDSFVSNEDVEETMMLLRKRLNVHDPKSRVHLDFLEISFNTSDSSITETDDDTKDSVTRDSDLNSDVLLEDSVIRDNNDTTDKSNTTIEDELLNNNVLSELDSDESVEVTTKGIEVDMDGKMTELGIIK